MDYLRLLIAFILPPVAVWMQFGLNRIFWINVLLTLLGYVPGLVHAIYMMATRPPGLQRLPPRSQPVKGSSIPKEYQ